MRWSKLLVALTLGVLASTALVTANPITDESSTSIEVTPTVVTPFGDETFTVAVQRVDDLLDNNGAIIAERVMDVKLNFDVNDDDVLINGVPVDLGISTIETDTAILVGSRAVAAGISAEDLKPAFDIGLVKIKVKAQADEMLLDAADLADIAGQPAEGDSSITSGLSGFIKVRRVVVAARILEINGHDVVQSELVEQVIDVMPGGGIRRGSPKAIPMLAGVPGVAFFPNAFDAEDVAADEYSQTPCHRGAHPIAQHAAHAWRRLPLAVRIGLATFFGSLLLLTVFVALPFAMYAQWRARRDPSYTALEAADDDASLDFGADVKKAGQLSDPQVLESSPPAYEETDVLVGRSSQDSERQA